MCYNSHASETTMEIFHSNSSRKPINHKKATKKGKQGKLLLLVMMFAHVHISGIASS